MSGNHAAGSPLDSPGRRPALASARVIGARHLRGGRPCQDAVRSLVLGDLVALAVADGHGTSAHGDVGAEIAADVAVHALARFAGDLGEERSRDARAVHAYAQHPLRVQLARAWTERVRAHAGAADAALQPYGTTLICALATPTFLLLGQIGDGDILMVDLARRVTRPLPPDPSSFADETASLCQNEAWTSIRVLTIPRPNDETLVLLSTDGYSKSYATDEIFERIGPDYLDLVRESGLAAVEALLPEFLSAVTQGGSGDDIAIGMLYWPAAPKRADRSAPAIDPVEQSDSCATRPVQAEAERHTPREEARDGCASS